jgi:hypothetical protein
MPNEFRFLVICQGATQRLDDHLVTLTGIVNTLEATAGERSELAAVVGAVVHPEWKGKRLDLMAWRLGKKGERLALPDYAGTPLILPEARGPQVMPYALSVPIPARGIYGFELFDPEGLFGRKNELLATYLFFAEVLP